MMGTIESYMHRQDAVTVVAPFPRKFRNYKN